MIAEAEPVGDQERAMLLGPEITSAKPPPTLLFTVFFLAGVALIGTVITAAFWGTWYFFAGSMPKLWDIFRFWLDLGAVPFYSLFLFFTIAYILTKWGGLKEEAQGEGFRCSFGDFLKESWRYPTVCVVVVIDFVISIFLSFATGLAIFVGLVVIVAAGILIYRMVCITLFVYFFFVKGIVGPPPKVDKE